MRTSQIAGFATTIAVVAWADLPLDWLVLVAMLAGGLATLAVETMIRRKR